MVQTCQVNWTIKIPANTLDIQLNRVATAAVADEETAQAVVNFNGKEDSTTAQTVNMAQSSQLYALTEVLHFWLGISTACGPFNQFAICKDSTKLWDTSIYAREQAVICSNSLSDLCTNNSVSVSPLESIIAGKRHCGVFIDVKMDDINKKATAAAPPLAPKTEYYRIPHDIVFSGVLDLNQLNPIFNSFPVLTRNYASLYLQLWMQDFLQDLKVVWLNKTDPIANRHLAYQMLPPEKPDIVYLQNEDEISYGKFSVRIVNMQDSTNAATAPQNSISQIKNAVFTKLEIQNVCFNVQNEDAIISLIQNQKIINFPTQVIRSQSSNFPFNNFGITSGSLQSIMSFTNIKAMFMTFAMPQYPTWFFPVLFHNFDLIIDQRHVIPQPYEALTQSVNGQMFDCFVDQDVVSAPSDLYHSLTFENRNINDQSDFYGHTTGSVLTTDNIFYKTTLFYGTKETKTLYPNKYMIAWKLATDDSFMRGYNSSKISARTNIQVILNGNLVRGINETRAIFPDQKQNNFAEFSGTRAYPDPVEVGLTPITHYLCDAIVQIMFDNNPDPQVLSLEVIGEMGGSMVRNG
ncbi:MAG: hypothetical protein EZS28_028690 [Streblomastix strix]|uniref:Uncharacterized protein n=1 Tax=Streblomastix strix TaxID=222440 RepID=A0A5J4UZW8_9EUKA|nr:MAG: hypothetical protein EZS28_028690 [Streblomastix strix]